jgi:DNA recombination protein RmuC
VDTATISVLLIGVIVGAVLGAGVTWFLVTSRARLAAAEAGRAAADASAMARADAAGLRAERAGLLERLDDLTERHGRAAQRA